MRERRSHGTIIIQNQQVVYFFLWKWELSIGAFLSTGIKMKAQFVRDRRLYMILRWWCDDNCIECACLYWGWQWQHTLLTPCIWSIPLLSDTYSDRKLQYHCRDSKYWRTVITAYQLEHSLRGQNFSHSIWGKEGCRICCIKSLY